jgi:8-oxo-dGTP diphosphatase
MERPKVGVGVCIIKDNKILFGQRKNSHGTGAWSFPGGHLELNESFEECARREVMEEAGISIKNLKFVTTTNDIFHQENKHYITVYMLAEYDSGRLENKEPEKLEKWELFEWHDLPQPLFLPIQNLLKQGFNPFSQN